MALKLIATFKKNSFGFSTGLKNRTLLIYQLKAGLKAELWDSGHSGWHGKQFEPIQSAKFYEKDGDADLSSIAGHFGFKMSDLQQGSYTNKAQESPKQKYDIAKSYASKIKKFYDIKQKYPDNLLLFRIGDFYEAYDQDAEIASKILGITLTRISKVYDKEGNTLRMTMFPFYSLDTYLPELISAGRSVAICNHIEEPEKDSD